MSSASSIAPVEQPSLSEAERVADTFVAPARHSLTSAATLLGGYRGY